MKKLTLTFCALFALLVVAPAIFADDGPERVSSKEKEVMQPAPPVCDFYRAHEWDLDIWGAYAFAADTGQFPVDRSRDEFGGLNVDPFTPDTDPFTFDYRTEVRREPAAHGGVGEGLTAGEENSDDREPDSFAHRENLV